MKNKGFTLIELLVTLFIIGLVATITTPIIIGVTSGVREKALERQIKAIEEAAERWGNDNPTDDCLVRLASGTLSDFSINVSDLQREGYLDKKDLKNPTDSKNDMDGCVKISYVQNYNQYKYSYESDRTKCTYESDRTKCS